MAQQIQFIYLSQSDYDSLNPKNAGRIYFTSDTHRIYRGSDLYAATTFDQLNFSAISATSLIVDGSAVSLEGHTHAMSEITDLDTTTFASSNHTHPELSGITQSTITKDAGTFTNLVVTNASIDATSITASGVEVNGGIQASTVSASSATFQSLTVTGDVTMSLPSVDFQNINASSLIVNGSAVSLEGHSHSASEISGLESMISAATSNFASISHVHAISNITGLSEIIGGITSSDITKETGTFTNLIVASASFTATNVEAEELSASAATFQTLTVTGEVTMSLSNVDFGSINASSLTVNGSSVSLEGHAHSASEISGLDAVISAATSNFASIGHGHSIADVSGLAPILSGIDASTIEKDTATFGNLVVTDSATFSATNVAASTLTATTGSFTNLFAVDAEIQATTISASAITVGGSNVSLEGHGHSVADIDGLASAISAATSGFASESHTHDISDVTNLSDILSGITSSSLTKDTVTADIGSFRLLSVSGSANFQVNTVSANTVTVNGTNVSLEGHGHSVADVSGLDTMLAGYASSGHTHSAADVTGLETALSAYALASHTHQVTDIQNLATALSGYASSDHTHAELAGITNTSISKTNGSFDVVTASTATFNTLNVTNSATIDVTNLVADAITVSDLNLTGTLSVSSTTISAMTVADMSVTNSLKLNNKDIATQEYVQLMISQAIGQVLASAY